MKTLTVKRGQTIRIILDDLDGIAGDVVEVLADLRSANRSTRLPDPVPAAASFTVAPRAAGASADDPAGWWLTIDAATCDDLAVGFYLVDARLSFGADDDAVTDPLAVEIVEPATVRPDA